MAQTPTMLTIKLTDALMAGLVPAIHVLQHIVEHWSRAWKVRLVVGINPESDDLFETIAK